MSHPVRFDLVRSAIVANTKCLHILCGHVREPMAVCSCGLHVTAPAGTLGQIRVASLFNKEGVFRFGPPLKTTHLIASVTQLRPSTQRGKKALYFKGSLPATHTVVPLQRIHNAGFKQHVQSLLLPERDSILPARLLKPLMIYTMMTMTDLYWPARRIQMTRAFH